MKRAAWSSAQALATRCHGCYLRRVITSFSVNMTYDNHRTSCFRSIDSKRLLVSMVSAKDLFNASRDRRRIDKKISNGQKDNKVVGVNHREAKRRLDWSVAYQLRRNVFDRECYTNTVFIQTDKPVPPQALENLSRQDLNALDDSALEEKLAVVGNAELSQKKTDLFKMFDDEFQSRLHKMKIWQLLYVADVFISCRYKATRFMEKLLCFVADRWEMSSISPQEVTQVAFIIAVNGRCNIELLTAMEKYVHQNLEAFRLDEVSVICLGFYRTRTSFRSYPLMDGIAGKVLSDWSHMHVQSLNNIFKQFKYGGYMTPSFYNTLGHHVAVQYASRKITDVKADIFQVLFLYASSRIYNESLVTTAHDRFVEFIFSEQGNSSDVLGKFRGKDVARLLWAFATFGFDLNETVVDSLVANFRSRIHSGEVSQYPGILVDVLLSLAYLGHYPDALLDHFFSKTNLNAVWDHPIPSKKVEAVLIWQSSLIESPSFQLNDESSVHIAQLAYRLPVNANHSVEMELKRRTGLQEILRSLQRLLPGHKVRCTFPLPQFTTASITVEQQPTNSVAPSNKTRPDSVLGSMQPQGGASVLSQLLHEKDANYELPWILNDGNEENVLNYPSMRNQDYSHKRYVVEVHGFNQYASCQSRLLGLHRMKVRQLRLSGHHVFVVPPTVVLRLSAVSSNDREQFLSESIVKHIQGQ